MSITNKMVRQFGIVAIRIENQEVIEFFPGHADEEQDLWNMPNHIDAVVPFYVFEAIDPHRANMVLMTKRAWAVKEYWK